MIFLGQTTSQQHNTKVLHRRLRYASTALKTLSKMFIFFFMQILESHKNRDIFSVVVFWTIFILCLLGATIGIALALARDADMPGYYNVFMTGTVLTSTGGTYFIFSFSIH